MKQINLTLFAVTLLTIASCNSNNSKKDEQTNAAPVEQEKQKTPEEIQAAEKQRQRDSVAEAERQAAELAEQKMWDNSKPGKIQKKHPDWTKEDCERVAENKIWIGMTLDMLKYERGNPSSANPSDYGSGREWQWCWDDYTPSCFYGGDDGIITQYN